MSKIVISATGVNLPGQAISTEELVASYNQHVENYYQNKSLPEKLPKSDADFILKASGIKSRYAINKSGILDPQIMHPIFEKRDPSQPSLQCEIAISAAKSAIAAANKSSQHIDLVIAACSNFQRAYPGIAIEIQEALGIEGFAYDMNVACASASFAIAMAKNIIEAGLASCALIVNPEIYTGHLNFKDRTSHFIFGDACTAVIVESEATVNSECAYKIISSKLQTKFSNNIRNDFGFLNRCELNNNLDETKLFRQNGKKVKEEVSKLAVKHLNQHLSANQIQQKDIKRLWLHQANIQMNQEIGKEFFGRQVENTELPIILDECGNTGAAGVIIAFDKFKKDLDKNDLGILCAFGAGYAVGSLILQKL